MDEEAIITKKIESFIDSLIEHHMVDVRCFVVLKEAGRYNGFSVGRGNPYATQCCIDDWLIIQKQKTRDFVSNPPSKEESF